MEQPALWLLSLNAFAAVMLLLLLLAAVVRGLTLAFPPPAAAPSAPAPSAATAGATGGGSVDPAVLAAIQVAVQPLLPGGRVTRVVPLPGPERRESPPS